MHNKTLDVVDMSLLEGDYTATHPPQNSKLPLNAVFWLSAGFLALFVLLAVFSPSQLTSVVNAGFSWSAAWFGAYWQVLLLATFVISLVLAFAQTGDVRLGGLTAPEIDSFRWIAMILCTLLAGGGVFWAAAEPIAHFISAPPIFSDQASSYQMAINALSQSFMHWGFLAWAILGTLAAIVLMHLHYDKGLPLQPRTLLYPIFGHRVLKGWFGDLIDACCMIAVAAGTIGPIGFLGLQISYALHILFDLPDSFATQTIVVLFAIAMYTLSALSGVSRGIQIVSRYNVILATGLMLFILLFGPTNFIVNGYIQGVGNLIDNFVPMATYRADENWLSWWTVFFWGWFIGYAPMMAIFIARISRGRTLRQLVLAISLFAPLMTCFWFTALGGSGLAFEIAQPGSVSAGFEGFNLPGALLAITQQLPFPVVISLLFLVLTTTFIVTTGDSMTYTMSVVMSGNNDPHPYLRAFWGIMMGAIAIALISLGEGGVSALQSFIVITAVPVSLILLPTLWTAPRYARLMLEEQQLKQL
ncbi:BCCT family transporter [Vibrio aestuarianus]|nr:putative BCCT transporter [Vibrio aestuarianus]